MKESKDIYEFLDRYKTNPFRKVDRSLILLLGADSPWGLYMVMRFATPDDGLCLFSRKGLSRMLKISLSTVKKYIIELQQLGLIEGLNSEPTEKGFRLLPLNFDKIKEKLLAEGLNSEPRKGAKKRTTGGLNSEPKGGQKMNQQGKENSLQQVEKKSEIDTLHRGLLDPILLDPILLDLKRIEKNRIECCEASASELSSASLADAFLIFENQIESLISQPLSRLFQEPFTIDLSNEELIRYRNTLPDSLPILKSTINAYSIFALHEYFFPSEYYNKSLRAECLQAIEDFAALMLQRHKVRLTDKLFCRAIMLLTPGEYTEYGQNYWCQFLMNGHIFKIYDQKMGIYKKFYAAITSERTCNLSNVVIHEKIS